MKTRVYLLKRFMFGLIVCLGISFQVMAETVVIINPASNVNSLSGSEIKAVYLGKTKRYVAVDQPEGSSIRKEFMLKVVEKSESQFKAYWSRKIFSGKGMPPQVMSNSAEVKSMVSRSSGAIGFIDSSLVDRSVKVVYRVN